MSRIGTPDGVQHNLIMLELRHHEFGNVCLSFSFHRDIL